MVKFYKGDQFQKVFTNYQFNIESEVKVKVKSSSQVIKVIIHKLLNFLPNCDLLCKLADSYGLVTSMRNEYHIKHEKT